MQARYSEMKPKIPSHSKPGMTFRTVLPVFQVFFMGQCIEKQGKSNAAIWNTVGNTGAVVCSYVSQESPRAGTPGTPELV